MAEREIEAGLTIRGTDLTGPAWASAMRKAQGFGNQLRGVNARLGLPRIAQEMKGVGAAAHGMFRAIEPFAAVVTAATGITAIAGIGGLAEAFREAGNELDAFAKTSRQLGIPLQTLREFSGVAERQGVAWETAQSGLIHAARGYEQIRDNMGKMNMQLQRIDPGLAASLRRAKTSTDALNIMFDAMHRARSESQRLQLSELFTGTTDFAKLDMSAREFRDLMAHEGDLLGRIDERGGLAAERWSDEVDDLKQSFKGLRDAVFLEFVGPASDAVKAATGWSIANRGLMRSGVRTMLQEIGLGRPSTSHASRQNREAVINWKELGASIRAFGSSAQWAAEKLGGWKNVMIGVVALPFLPLAAATAQLAGSLLRLGGVLASTGIGRLAMLGAALALPVWERWGEIGPKLSQSWNAMAAAGHDLARIPSAITSGDWAGAQKAIEDFSSHGQSSLASFREADRLFTEQVFADLRKWTGLRFDEELKGKSLNPVDLIFGTGWQARLAGGLDSISEAINNNMNAKLDALEKGFDDSPLVKFAQSVRGIGTAIDRDMNIKLEATRLGLEGLLSWPSRFIAGLIGVGRAIDQQVADKLRNLNRIDIGDRRPFTGGPAARPRLPPAVGDRGRAEGGRVWAGQSNWVGEHGPELVKWARDAIVIPADISRQLAARGVAPPPRSRQMASTAVLPAVAGLRAMVGGPEAVRGGDFGRQAGDRVVAGLMRWGRLLVEPLVRIETAVNDLARAIRDSTGGGGGFGGPGGGGGGDFGTERGVRGGPGGPFQMPPGKALPPRSLRGAGPFTSETGGPAPAPFSKAGKTFAAKSAQIVPRLMKDLGIGREDAAAIVGNLGTESGGFKHFAELGGGPGRGWAQWTTKARKTAFFQYANAHGLDPRSDEASYGYLVNELKNRPDLLPRANVLAEMRAAKGLAAKTAVFMRGFENPGVPNLKSRLDYAGRAMATPDAAAAAPPRAAPRAPISTGRPKPMATIVLAERKRREPELRPTVRRMPDISRQADAAPAAQRVDIGKGEVMVRVAAEKGSSISSIRSRADGNMVIRSGYDRTGERFWKPGSGN